MEHQQWLTVGASTLIVTAIACFAAPSKPAAVIASSTAGAVGGVFLSNSRRSPSHKSNSTKTDLTKIQVTLDEKSLASITNLESLLQQEGHGLKTFTHQIEQIHSLPEEATISAEEEGDRFAQLEKLLKQSSSKLSNLEAQLNEVVSAQNRAKRTAIFYDIENLLKGYNFSQEMLANLSLKEIFKSIQETEYVGDVSVQQAYANWSDPRLKIMRGEINELGINPIQVFGFSRDPTKNAADIQLVIDAVNLANIRSSIDVFVIVSGDGGFASLAKQLHEYGKTVIGCAYPNSASKTFQAVCDDFIWISDPEEEEHSYSTSKQVSTDNSSDNRQTNGKSLGGNDDSSARSPGSHKKVSSPSPNQGGSRSISGLDARNTRLVNQIGERTPTSKEETITLTREILKWYANDQICQSNLSRSGIYLSIVEQAVSYLIPDLQKVQLGQLGFPKFVEYMQYICQGTELCVVRIPPSKVTLVLRDSIPKNAHVLPDLDAREVHSPETYRSILSTGSPIYRLSSPGELYAIASWLIEHPFHQKDLGTIIEDVVSGLNGEISSEVVKLTLFSFLTGGIFIREPEGVPTSEQVLTLREDIESLDHLIQILNHEVTQKLTAVLSSVDEAVLQQILPMVR